MLNENPRSIYVNSSWLYQIFMANKDGNDMSFVKMPSINDFIEDIKSGKFDLIVLDEEAENIFNEDIMSSITSSYFLKDSYRKYLLYKIKNEE